nr:MAG TPA: hypothetical protein [Caudoviricetes sp.]
MIDGGCGNILRHISIWGFVDPLEEASGDTLASKSFNEVLHLFKYKNKKENEKWKLSMMY